MSRSMFDLDIMEMPLSESVDGLDDILNSPINEESEFTNAESKPTAHMEPNNSVKGVMKGDNVEMTPEEHNKAVQTVKKAANEAKKLMEGVADVLSMLENVSMMSTGDSQEDYLEESMLVAYEDGPFFEKSGDKNKDKCKSAARKLRKKVLREGKRDDIAMMKVSVLAKGEVEESDELWKVVGIVIAAKDAAEGFAKVLQERLSRDLEGCKLSVVQASKAQLEAINKKRKQAATEAYLIKVSK